MLEATHNSEVVMTSCLSNNFIKNLKILFRGLNNNLLGAFLEVVHDIVQN